MLYSILCKVISLLHVYLYFLPQFNTLYALGAGRVGRFGDILLKTTQYITYFTPSILLGALSIVPHWLLIPNFVLVVFLICLSTAKFLPFSPSPSVSCIYILCRSILFPIACPLPSPPYNSFLLFLYSEPECIEGGGILWKRLRFFIMYFKEEETSIGEENFNRLGRLGRG
uniref:Uncharacterized protein n=1 Tax=Cacopsylla melanoneura TaxID=428564 RepID=A0A8D8TZP9_9HEMI